MKHLIRIKVYYEIKHVGKLSIHQNFFGTICSISIERVTQNSYIVSFATSNLEFSVWEAETLRAHIPMYVETINFLVITP